eukprot:Opistho-2@18284
MATITDDALRGRIETIVASADLSTMTIKTVRAALEDALGVDLTDRRAFIRATVDELLDALQGEPEDEIHNDQEMKEEGDNGDEDAPASASDSDEIEDDGKDAKRTVKGKKAKVEKSAKKEGGKGGFSGQLLELSPELASLVHAKAMSRTQVVKSIWEHIRAHDLQDPKDRRYFFCDAPLMAVFGEKRMHAFGMNKFLSAHFVGGSAKPKPQAASVTSKTKNGSTKNGSAAPKSSSKRKREEEEEARKRARGKTGRTGKIKSTEYVHSGSEGSDGDDVGDGGDLSDEALARKLQDEERGLRRRSGDTKRKKPSAKKSADGEKKRGGGGNSGLNKPLMLSEKLAGLVGCAELSRPQVVKAIWAHVNAHNLKDPRDKRFILCDDRLRSVFGCDRVHSFGMNKLLGSHLKDKEHLAL